MMARRTKEHYQGCLLGGAIGDALGAAVEFLNLSAIRKKYGPQGIQTYISAYGRKGAITDDTQMTLFTAEAMIRSHNSSHDWGIWSPVDIGRFAYFRWLSTQGRKSPYVSDEPGWLIQQNELNAQRAPGNTCLAALRAGAFGSIQAPENDSKGCGGVMRMAPVGLVHGVPMDYFELGCDLAALTHGHPSGYLPAGFFSMLSSLIADGMTLEKAIEQSIDCIKRHEGHQETLEAINKAIALAADSQGSPEDVEKIGEGWTGEEALAISLYCALRAKSFEHGVILAVNHSGDSDSTGSITGNILGLIHGLEAIPEHFMKDLELLEVIIEIATDMWIHFGEGTKPVCADFDKEGQSPDWDKYPGN